MICKKCNQNQAGIEQAPDAWHKIVKCYACGHTEDLRNYNKKPMKAEIIFANGKTKKIKPKNNTDFTLEELQKIVKGSMQIVQISHNKIMVMNEEGKILDPPLPFNHKATAIYRFAFKGIKDIILGDILICNKELVK